ncbi:MAG: GAF domain-containing protein [Anaerolineae bacterium]|nr:GAF domain-containing protein [Anaerolineae bacterium]
MNSVLGHLKEIVSAVTTAAEAGTLEQVLENIAEVSRKLVGARYAALGVPDSDGSLRYFKTAGITPEEAQNIDHLPTGKGLLGVIMRERKTLRIERMQDDERAAGFCEGHPMMTSLLGVPIQAGERLFGMLYLCDRIDREPFSEEDQILIEAVAGYAALAIAGSHLREQQKRLTLLEERERISMELHDGVIQSLYAIGMSLEMAHNSGNSRDGVYAKAVNGLNAVIEDIRRYIMNLNAIDQRQRTIHECLQEMTMRLHIPSSLSVTIDAPDDYPPFTGIAFEAICQIIHEAVSNVIRHSAATRLEISVQEKLKDFRIIIADDGKGFDFSSADNHKGLGLHNIQQRVSAYGGQIDVDTAPGQGTRLTVTLPL